MKKSTIVPLAMVAALGIAGIGTAIAQTAGTSASQTEQSDAMELAAIESVKLNLTDAIAAAEQETGGKAVDAGFEDENGTYAYEVELLDGNGERTVLVDADTGKVTQVAQNDDNGDDEAGEAEEAEGAENGEDND